MSHSLPAGSAISLSTLNGYQLISLPYKSTGLKRYFIAAFLTFWLGGWGVGFSSALGTISAGKGGAFMLVWIAGWTLGGIAALFTLYRLFQPSQPQQLLLNKPELSVDMGREPFDIQNHGGRGASLKKLLPKRQRYSFSPAELQTLALRETDDGNRLTLDRGNERLELAKDATEIEREWLFQHLAAQYRLGYPPHT
ncbi:hypothetical protein ACQUQU_12355 [Thalassolituus sp. LLYu03]|uniref:hypothetical protein n=1 Tax=Thalassolituus sp. LLYu03 TaxID=3421656 RepID=UPI003D2E077D